MNDNMTGMKKQFEYIGQNIGLMIAKGRDEKTVRIHRTEYRFNDSKRKERVRVTNSDIGFQSSIN
jgi:hypothetical protein